MNSTNDKKGKLQKLLHKRILWKNNSFNKNNSNKLNNNDNNLNIIKKFNNN